MEIITIKLTNEEIIKLKETFKNSISSKTPDYALFQIKCENCTITAYNSLKVVFQGKDAHIYASPFKNNHLSKSEAGSDEVGTGDYFGPITVCACIVEEKDCQLLKDLKVQDSKNISDNQILKIAPILVKELKHSLLILDNKKYNRVHISNNINKIKAKLHNQAFIHLKNKYGLPDFKIIDQFTSKANYYNYLRLEKEIIKDIIFETKAENKYPSVASASIIARYAFLKTWEEMEKKYDFTFIKGAGDKVDKNIAEFVKKFGSKELNNVAKIHFKNTKKYVNYL